MQSLASLMSVNTTEDIVPVEDFEKEDEGEVLQFGWLKLLEVE